jgi:hypothetical protein
VIVGLLVLGALVVVLVAALLAQQRRPPGRRPRRRGGRRVLLPFTRGDLDSTVLAAAIRVARAEDAVLVPAYLLIVPLQFAENAALSQEVERALPLLEAVEHAALLAGVPVDARFEKGRTPTHALQRLWNVERFDRIVAPAPTNGGGGFTPRDLTWLLTHAPAETLVLRPAPALPTRAAQLLVAPA